MSEKSAIQWTDATKWCIGCKTHHSVTDFGFDRSRYDGLASKCRAFKRHDERQRYKNKHRPAKGRRFVAVRDGDEKQARRRVNYFVEAGIIPHPNKLPCADCGHVFEQGGKRHEYDHHLGYEKDFHEQVQSVCATCHKKRTNGKSKSNSMV